MLCSAGSSTGFTLVTEDTEVNGLGVCLSMVGRGNNGRTVVVKGIAPCRIRKNTLNSSVLFENDQGSTTAHVVILSSLSIQLLEDKEYDVIQRIVALKGKSEVLGVVDRDIVSIQSIGRLASIANKIVNLSRIGQRIAADVRVMKKNGLIQDTRLWLSMASNGKLVEEKRIEGKGEEEGQVKKMDKEKKKEEGIRDETMPYAMAQSEEGLVRIHEGKVRVGGRVIYCPDEEDDLDEDDPDDDLHI